MARALRISQGPAVFATVLVLAGVDVVDVRVAHAALAVGPACAGVLLAIARLSGLSVLAAAAVWAWGAP